MSDQKALDIEVAQFQMIRERVAGFSSVLLKTARRLAELDVLAGFAEVAARKKYTRPEFVNENVLVIQGGRHPVVENFTTTFVPNGLELGHSKTLMILTGPNMSGKSTYLRQAALIILMAQIGCFVPADTCQMGVCDQIFSRIGAKDEIALGQSTFMVEMVESAYILRHATERSLVILDEIGRGTSTYDGLAIAWAMAEDLSRLGAKTIFATHYHQLNQLADTFPNILNARVHVEERDNHIIWSHKVLEGGTDKSYGLHVAKMAGIPQTILERAQDVLATLESQDRNEPMPVNTQNLPKIQMQLFEPEEATLRNELKALNLDQLSPIEALLKLHQWRKQYVEAAKTGAKNLL